MLPTGLYEQVINRLIANALSELDDRDFHIQRDYLDDAESATTLAHYMTDVIEAGLRALPTQDALQRRIAICNQLIALLARETGQAYIQDDYTIAPDAELLLALLDKRNTALGVSRRAQTNHIPRPETSIAETSLFTGAPHEPSMMAELKKEITTSDRIDMLVSFIRWSGLRLLMDELREFTQTGRLRIITTSYMGATDIKAIDELRELPNTDIRVSYDTHQTRLHAKAYIFHRKSGFSTAYVGSSNVSKAALMDGLEWNVKVAAKDLPTTFQKITATFDGYWHDYGFQAYHADERATFVAALRAEQYKGAGSDTSFAFDIRPYQYQQEILDKLDAERRIHGHLRNLIVAATGTGKTVISAFDYKRFCTDTDGRMRPKRLLFVAHREEILRQSLDCFRGILRDPNFGDLFVGGYEPSNLDHLFVSIQTLNSRSLLQATTPDYYDFIVVDEFHHTAANSYRDLLNYYQPAVLLGLTATPERLDGQDVTAYFDHRIAAEIRLPEAIDRGLLSSFQYFGVTDTVDLRTLHWRRGSYDTAELSNLYTDNRQRADLVVRSLRRYVTDVDQVIGLGFCVSVHHASFMAAFMNQHAIPSIALHGQSSGEERRDAKRRLTSGELRFIFVVDLYNEGVDIPEVNTILFLRPTESLTVFMQQLGRGLRLSNKKECLTVLDFIGQSHQSYRFEEKLAALLRNTRRSVQKEVQDGFLNTPRGCFIQLERQAKEYILDNIRTAISTRRGLVSRIAAFAEDSGRDLTVANFADYYHLTMRDLYRGQNAPSFARLCVQAGVRDSFSDPDESTLAKALPRIAAVNSRRWLAFLLGVLDRRLDPPPGTWSEPEYQMLLMFHYTVWQKSVVQCGFSSLAESVDTVLNNPVLCGEICDILHYNLEHIDFVDEPVNLGFDNVLDLHCTYSRDQVLAALGFYAEDRMPAMREGVKYLEDKKLDLLFITLNKSDKDYSPTTMYQDYAINDVLFHWQSQSTTPADSPTGQRYIHHRSTGNRVALFVREYKSDASGTTPYTYVGLANYVQHTGSRPMNITWRLQKPMPAAMMRQANQVVVG
ncbi:DUF3427 domain-containing protein [Alicyclobacillus sp. ALC3]|uniref:DUF3427 domain-containing protein n=1 Tax=Alicyclobacillus sp. ALC3 TaxID=2796143 RepID=UPI002379B3E9|nr:DEAD/DEAH box helicase [Alicyclobacillus sp. ALC3]WDL99107.1 DUF3427 domain-containing protein [Alicyclobacillus sp. ALC3]